MAAQKNSKKTTAAKESGRQSSKKKSTQQAAGKRPLRREIGALVCFSLCVVSVLACFNVSSLLTNGWELLAKGLFGRAGLYILPFSLFLMSVILLFHGGRPVRLRTTCAFLLVICIGVLRHLMSGDMVEIGIKMFNSLWTSGVSGTSGGVVCGLLAILMEKAISKIASVIVIVTLLLICLLTSMNMTIPSIVRAIRNRPRLEYDEPEEAPEERAAVIVNHVAQKRIDRAQQRRVAANKRIEDYDLPVDDPPEFQKEKPKASQRTSPADRKKRTAAEQAPQQLTFEPVANQTVHVPQPIHAEKQTVSEDGKQRNVGQDPALIRTTESPEQKHVQTPMDPEMSAAFSEHLPQKVLAEEARASAIEIENQINAAQGQQQPSYIYPTKQLLQLPEQGSVDATAEMRENAKRLDDTLASFGIDAHIVNVTRGPSITRYELELDRGVKLSKLTGLADDIALSLGASGVRISAIPDKISVVGIEVPNKLVSTVFAREVIDSGAFTRAKSKLSFAVGKDIGGNCIIGDIAKLPHLLIAGTTGSGKSVCMNSLIISLLYKASPDEVKLIMIDPKMVELGIYNGIPHLLIPVVTDPKKAAGSLQWAVTEMMRRYRMMADAGVRNLEEYNKIASNSDEFDAMPQIVVVIDELADLMLVAAKEVEESICRVAQMGRASGIHLIVATQRPSADVITGLMKANIPSRIAFAVASAIESRIILDTVGAEKLVGKGDMLFAPLGQGKPKRVQGCFITDEEVQAVVSFIKQQKLETSSEYQKEILEQIDRRADMGKQQADNQAVSSGGDELLPAAVEVILDCGQASVSLLQRRLKLGYARAARIVDEMEDRGIVGPFEGSKPRQLLITKEQWQAMQNGETLPPQEPVEEEIPEQ